MPSKFDSLMKRLVQVPKAEIDEEERKYLAQRARLKKRGEAKKKRVRNSGSSGSV